MKREVCAADRRHGKGQSQRNGRGSSRRAQTADQSRARRTSGGSSGGILGRAEGRVPSTGRGHTSGREQVDTVGAGTDAPQLGSLHMVMCDRLNDDGDGVTRVEGWTMFVPHLLPGEAARVSVSARERRFLRGRVVERAGNAAPERATPPCAVFGACGGCQLQHLDYSAQLAHKQHVVQQALARIGKLPDITVQPTLGMTDPWRYRNHVQVPLDYVAQDNPHLITGFFATNSHSIVQSETCELEPVELEHTIALAVQQLARGLGPQAAALHHLIARRSHTTGEMMLILATREGGEEISDAVRGLIDLPGVVSVAYTVQPRSNGPVWGPSAQLVAGRPHLTERLNGIEYIISPRSFFQVNTTQAEVLVQTALDFANVGPSDAVLDAYCGAGTITLPLARRAKAVIGIESVPEAVADARRNAEHNGVGNVDFIAGAVERVLPELMESGQRFDAVVLDPPRKGCDRSVLDALISADIPRVVYVSCNHATLARDLRILVDGGYRVDLVQPVDMFPQTSHVECVVATHKVD